MDKTIHLKVSKELHRIFKARAAEQGMTMTDYFSWLLQTKAAEASIPPKVTNKINLSDLKEMVAEKDQKQAEVELRHTPKGHNGFYDLQAKPQVMNVIEAEMTPEEEAHWKKKKAEQDKSDELIRKGQERRSWKFCQNGHVIPLHRSKCFGKGCKYA